VQATHSSSARCWLLTVCFAELFSLLLARGFVETFPCGADLFYELPVRCDVVDVTCLSLLGLKL